MPAALQNLNLLECDGVEGKFQPRLAPFVRPTNTIEHLSCGPAANLLLPLSDPQMAFLFSLFFARIQGTSRRSNGPQRFKSSICVTAGRSQVRLSLIYRPTNTNEQPLVRPQPQISSFLLLTRTMAFFFSWLFARI